MKPQTSPANNPSAFQLFQSRLDQQLDPNHPLVLLADLIQWQRFDDAFAPLYCPDNGAPALPTRLMVGLEYLKYTYNLSDEELAARWLENPYWQYFCGEEYFQTTLPFHCTSLGKWRKRIGAEQLTLLLEETIRIAKDKNYVNDTDLSRVIVDTTVQEKNITFPTDAKLLFRAITKLAKHSLAHGIALRQSYARKAKRMHRKASGYAAARQFGRLKRCNRNLNNWLGRVLRDIDRKRENKELSPAFLQLIETATKLLSQERHTKNKVYRGHDYKGQAVVRIAGSSNNGLSVSEKKRKKRRSAIEPVIGHMKKDHRLDRCMLKGSGLG